VIAEYDALPELGHGCGHNLITVTAVTAACGMAACRRNWQGAFEVIGTPAEEMLAGKSIMADAGAFDHLDACFMTHPAAESMPTARSNALKSFVATFRGKASHAAAAPQNGINALDAAILFFNSANAFRQHLPEDGRIHGIITKGGTSHNVIPELAEIQVGIRSQSEQYLAHLEKRVAAMCRAAAKAIGATCSIRWDRHWYRAFKLNPALDLLLKETYGEAGISLDEAAGRAGRGSVDMANVSQIVPAAHPFFSIVPAGTGDVGLHTREFLHHAATPHAYRQALKAGTAMAVAAARLLTEKPTLKAVKRDFAPTPSEVG
jgi:amidohydrolase